MCEWQVKLRNLLLTHAILKSLRDKYHVQCSVLQKSTSFNPDSPEMAFSALTLLVGHQEEHLACDTRVTRCWHGYLCG